MSDLLFGAIKSKVNEYCDFSDIILALSMIFVGGFNDYIACLISVALLLFLFFKISKQKSFEFKVNLLSASIFVIVGFYGLTTLWAIDTGMAFIGFLKFLPLAVYMVYLSQNEKLKKFAEVLPYFVAVIALVTGLLSLIPAFSSVFLVSKRLAGSFQYPNTFALLLLVCELLLLKRIRKKPIDFLVLAILIGGLLYTGSRTVFIIFLVANFFMILTNASKKMKILIFSVSAVVVLAVLLVAVLGPEGNVLSRYLKIGLTQSTFVGRLLYMADSLPLLIKYPFGMGYLGYHFVQGSIQTGVYNVSYVHNDFLQLALDVGIVPTVIFIVAVVKSFLKKDLEDKIIVGAFLFHSLLDFNFQFVGMFMLLLMLLNYDSGKVVQIKKPKTVRAVALGLAVISFYMSISLALSQFTAYEASNSLYPYNTRNKLLILEKEDNVARANEIANDILKTNTHYYAPYSIKAKYCYSKGDFVGVIENKNQVFLKNRFRYAEYREYSVMLVNGILAYEQMGDSASANVLKKELLNLKKGIESNKQKVSVLGGMINEQPVTTLPSDILEYIDNITNEAGGLN